MKKHHYYYLASVCLVLNACGPVYVVHQDPPVSAPQPAQPESAPPPAQPEDVSYQSFYDQLSPYGQWIDDPEYGYIWLPDAGPDFKPYATNGNWIYTDEGWTWNSGYPWGWAAFHYGRWFFQNGYGWMWIPGNEWAPAWVTWRNSDEYYGWAPLGPNTGYAAGGYTTPAYSWNFVPHRYVGSPQINNYYVQEVNNVTIINRTTIINNRRASYGSGPDPAEVGRFTGAPVRSMPIRDGRSPGGQAGNNSLTLYRPRVTSPSGNQQNGNGGRPASAPPRFQRLNDARPVNRTTYNDNRPPASLPAASLPVQPAPNQSAPPAYRPANTPVTAPNNPPGRSTTFPGRPVNPQPNGQPANGQPVNPQPANRQPANGQPVNGQPVNRQPVNPQPANPPAGRPRSLQLTNPPTNRPVTLPGNRAGSNPPPNFPNRPGPTANPPRPGPTANSPKPAPPKVPPPPKPKPDDPKQK
jgi:hypothetical protein